MSFAYLALYTGDYLRDTRHLSCSEHGIYLMFLMHCWDSRGPVPLDERKQAGICGARSGDEIEAMRRVLGEFFILSEDGHYNSRMQREVERSQTISAARSHAGFKGYQAKAKQLPSKSKASATTPPPPLTTTTTTNTTPSGCAFDGKDTSTSKPKAKKQAQAPFVLPEEIPQKQWDAWIEARLKKRNAPTDFAKKIAVSKLIELADQGHHPAAVLAQSAFHGWAGLFPIKQEGK